MATATKHKNKKKNIPKSINEMSKEKLEETLKKKKECNAKAQEIVEALCELQINENWLLSNLQFINQTHFEDITVERSILKLCGYPLCDNQIPKVTQQQYHISTRYNKVFDVTERKNFCSSSCYKAATHIKNQLFTSPLWFRDQEIIPQYTVLKESKSSLGKEIVFLPEKISLEPGERNMTSQKSRAQKPAEVMDKDTQSAENSSFLKKIEKDCAMVKKDFLLNDKDKVNIDKNQSLAINEKSDIQIVSNLSSMQKVITQEVENEFSKLNISDEDEIKNLSTREDQEYNSKDPKVLYTQNYTKGEIIIKKPIKVRKHLLDSIEKVEMSIIEWFSLDTLFFIYGEKKIKELFKDSSSQMKEALNSKLSMASYDDQIEKMIKLYGLLDSENYESVRPNLKPLPDYSALQQESKFLDIKVKAFYSGSLEIKETSLGKQEKKEGNDQNDSDDINICLPLIDSQAQNSLRRKILLDKLGKVLPELMKIFSRDYIFPMSEIKKLITTFTLTPHNITFKPAEWSLVGLILIKLLSLKDKYLSSVLKLESTQEQLEVLLTTCNLKPDYLDSLIKKLIDSQTIIKKIG